MDIVCTELIFYHISKYNKKVACFTSTAFYPSFCCQRKVLSLASGFVLCLNDTPQKNMSFFQNFSENLSAVLASFNLLFLSFSVSSPFILACLYRYRFFLKSQRAVLLRPTDIYLVYEYSLHKILSLTE